MNTSHNKNRVIQYGWKNVMRNIFGLKTDNNALSNSQENILNKEQKTQRNNIKQSKSKQHPASTRLQDCSHGDLFTISQIRRAHARDELHDGIELNVPFSDKPSTSLQIHRNKNYTISTHQELLARIIQESTLMDGDTVAVPDENMQDILRMYITFLLDAVKDEYWYIHFFKQLAEFYSSCKNGMKPTLAKNKFLYNEFTSDRPDDWSNRKICTEKQNDIHPSKYIEGNLFRSIKSDEDLYFNHVMMKGKKECRNLKRTKILIQLQLCENNEKFCELFEQLLDLEENFIM